MNKVPDGYGFVAGRGRDTAKALLEAAEDTKTDALLVRTTLNGFVAPEKVVAKYEEGLSASKSRSTRKASTKSTSEKSEDEEAEKQAEADETAKKAEAEKSTNKKADTKSAGS